MQNSDFKLVTAISVLAALKTAARFIAVLDLANLARSRTAYDSIVKELLLQKIAGQVDTNLANQRLTFLLTVRTQVAGDITKAEAVMKIVLTQGGTYSPVLFKLYINDLLNELHAALTDEGKDTSELDPIRLVADDVVCMVKDKES